MADVWVYDVDGTTLVRADAITTIKVLAPGGGEVRVSVHTANENIVVRVKEGVSQPGDNYDATAVLEAGRALAEELAEHMAQAVQSRDTVALHYPLEVHTPA